MNKRPGIYLFFIVYGAMFLFGFVENLKGITYPLIKEDLNVGYEQQGLMVSLTALSYVICCAAGGVCLARFGVKKAFLAGLALMGAGLALAFFMPSFAAVGAALFVVFAGFGFLEVSINALATQIFTVKAALCMNLLHFFYGAGSSLSPRFAGFVAAGSGWRQVYLFSLPLTLLLLASSGAVKFPARDPEAGETGKPVSFTGALKDPLVWLFSVTLGLMVTAEMGTANWGGLYFKDIYGLDPRTTGAGFLSAFFILFTLSRLLSGFLIEKIGYLKSLAGAIAGVLAVYIAGFALGPRGIYALPLLGFFAAIFWPTMMAVAMGCFGKDAPVMTSVMIVVGGLLNSVIQLVIGFTNRIAGPAWGYRSCLLYGVLLLGVFLVLIKRIGHKTRAVVSK